MSTLTDTETLTGPVARAAAAAAAVLPAATPLVPGTPVPGAGGASAGFAGAVVTELHLPGAPRVAVLVGTDLVEALASSPLGGLDLAAATQPALDAAAAALGTGCGAAREVSVALVDADLGGPFVLVPLLGGGVPCGALLVADAAVAAAGAVGAVVPAGPRRVPGPARRADRCRAGRPACCPLPPLLRGSGQRPGHPRHRDAARRRPGGGRRARPHPHDGA